MQCQKISCLARLIIFFNANVSSEQVLQQAGNSSRWGYHLSAVKEDKFFAVELVNGQSVPNFFVTCSQGANLKGREITVDLFEQVAVLGAHMLR